MRRRLTEREQAPLRAALGILGVIIGLSIATPHIRYPDGDIRNDPLFWTISGMVVLLFGTYLIVLAVLPWLRRRRRGSVIAGHRTSAASPLGEDRPIGRSASYL